MNVSGAKKLCLTIVLLIVGGCAFNKADDSSVARSERSDSSKAQASAGPKSAVDKIEALTIDDVVTREEPNTQTLYDNSRYDFPITMNSRVEGWIDYFTGRGRGHFERYLSRSSRYIPVMKHILRNAGLPEDLVYLAMIESGFNVRANSRAKAVGPWQFMAATGRRYGLRVDAWIDERRDPIRSTEAAARYLKDLYLMFESWYLAAAAYNAGENKILRGVQELKTNNYWQLAHTNIIRRETKDYVPKLIAAAILAKNPERFGFEEIAYQDPLDFETVTVDYSIRLLDIANLINASHEDLMDLNPELRRGLVPPGTPTYTLRVPVGSQVLVQSALVAKRDSLAKAVSPVEYRVRRGDTLSAISRRFGIGLRELAQLNNLKNTSRLYPGRELIIPAYASGMTGAAGARRVSIPAGARPTTQAPEPETETGKFVTHKVQKGDSLWSISVQYNVTIQDIFRWNNLKRSKIHPGIKLRIRPNSKEANVESSIPTKGKRS